MNKERAKQFFEEIKEIAEKSNRENAEPIYDLSEELRGYSEEQIIEFCDIAIESLKYDDEQVKFLKNSLDYVDNKKDNDWIDTKIKTPKNTRKVIATTTDEFVGEMNYDPETKEWYHYGDLVFEGVIGWKEKPKPYKRKENENE